MDLNENQLYGLYQKDEPFLLPYTVTNYRVGQRNNAEVNAEVNAEFFQFTITAIVVGHMICALFCFIVNTVPSQEQ